MSENIERDSLLRLWALLFKYIQRSYSIAGTVHYAVMYEKNDHILGACTGTLYKLFCDFEVQFFALIRVLHS